LLLGRGRGRGERRSRTAAGGSHEKDNQGALPESSRSHHSRLADSYTNVGLLHGRAPVERCQPLARRPYSKPTMPRTRRRSRAAHLGPEKRRPLVLDAAVGLFVERGYAGTSMEMIAEAAGVTRPVVYDCYPNKAELFRALVEREEGRLLDELFSALPTEPRLDDVEALMSESFTSFLHVVVAIPDSWRIVFLSEPETSSEALARVVRARELVTERLAELSRFVLASRGADDVERLSRLVAYQLVGLAEASVRLMFEHPGDWSPEELGRVLGRMTASAERMLTGRS
jgi:AcrR family transcriptional regulator